MVQCFFISKSFSIVCPTPVLFTKTFLLLVLVRTSNVFWYGWAKLMYIKLSGLFCITFTECISKSRAIFTTPQVNTYSKPTIERLRKGVMMSQNIVNDFVQVSLLFTLKTYFTSFFYCCYCWLWTRNFY